MKNRDIYDGKNAERQTSLFIFAGSVSGFTVWGSNLVTCSERFDNIYAFGLCHPTYKLSSKEITR
jgi:hypothetical protein